MRRGTWIRKADGRVVAGYRDARGVLQEAAPAPVVPEPVAEQETTHTDEGGDE
jgi:hypothetical protein